MAAELVAAELAEILGAIVVPAGPYGVTPIHAGHPGTISLRREVFESYLSNLCEELVAMGARTFVFVNWHEGNIASLDAVATHDPDLARLEHVREPTRPEGAEELDAMRRSREVYGYITDVTEIADDGWYGNPAWADQERAHDFARTVADEIAVTVTSILKMRGGRS